MNGCNSSTVVVMSCESIFTSVQKEQLNFTHFLLSHNFHSNANIAFLSLLLAKPKEFHFGQQHNQCFFVELKNHISFYFEFCVSFSVHLKSIKSPFGPKLSSNLFIFKSAIFTIKSDLFKLY